MSAPDRRSGFDWTAFDAYLFDIDGTLLHSRDGVHYNSFHTALREIYGSDQRIDNVPVHGNTDIGILRAATTAAGISPSDFETRLPKALQLMCAEVERNAAGITPQLCPSIEPVLQSLKGKGKLIGIVSGNLESIGWRKLSAAGIRDYFDFGSFSDRNELRRDIFHHGREEVSRRLGPHATLCFLGDTPSDIQAARALDAPVIALATGIFSLEALQAESPDLCITCCTDLLS